MNNDRKDFKGNQQQNNVAKPAEEKIGKRTPMYKQRALGIKQRPGFIRRQVVEKPGRVEAMMEAGWTVVSGTDENIRDQRLQNDSQLGSVVRQVVNRNPGLTPNAVWMEIKQEWYDEDMKAKQQMNNERSAAWNPKNIEKANPDQYYGGSLKDDKVN